MVRAFFVREDVIEFCLYYIQVHNIYCQEVASPACEEYDEVEEFKLCLQETEKAKFELKAMCQALKGTEFENICQGD
ncbi:MAG: hypothetical protein ACXQTI_10915 [Candidatus Nezhaarchaeales archaeon]